MSTCIYINQGIMISKFVHYENKIYTNHQAAVSPIFDHQVINCACATMVHGVPYFRLPPTPSSPIATPSLSPPPSSPPPSPLSPSPPVKLIIRIGPQVEGK